jgi:hypothetical protein
MQRETVRPAVYPALESEIYRVLDLDRETEIPPPSSQLTLELECAGVEVQW